MADKQYTIDKIEDQPLINSINMLIRLEKKSCLGLWDLDRNAILEKVKTKTGLNDLGNKRYLGVLDKFLENAKKLELTPLAEYFVNFVARKATTNRLYIEEFLKQHPEIVDIPIKEPVFIAGFPRTGTTLLQNILSVGPGYRALYFWELVTPYPLDENPAKDKRKRIHKVRIPLGLVKLRLPEIPNVHDVRVDTKEECWLLLANTLVILNIDLGTGMHDWNNWLLSIDRVWAYEEYKRMLQIQAYVRPTERLVLKCPTHLWNLEPILQVFPDAHIVVTHRNPVKSIASICSIAALGRKFFFGSVNKQEIGTLVESRNEYIIQQVMKFRDKVGDDPFYDMNFETLIKDIPESVRNIHRHFNLLHTSNHDHAVQNFLDKPRDDKPGRHKYSPQQFGLDPKEIKERFKQYITRYNIKV